MVRKECPHSDDRLGSGSPAVDAHGLVEGWLERIRKRMPRGSILSATVQEKPPQGYLATFRLQSDEEVLSSEARAASPHEAVEVAGQGLCQHLPLEVGAKEDDESSLRAG